jgi:molybdopterin-binding protein
MVSAASLSARCMKASSWVCFALSGIIFEDSDFAVALLGVPCVSETPANFSDAESGGLRTCKTVAMRNESPMLTPREAARLLGVSYATIKQWILSGKLRTVQTPGGHHRLTEAALKPFLQKDKSKSVAESRQRYRRVSGRNQLPGKVVSIRIEGLLAEVVLSVGDTQVTAIITANAVRELQLKKGDTAAALIKSTDVMIERLDDPA